MDPSLQTLKSLLGRVADLTAAANILEWDQETYMPEGAAEARAHQLATLRQLAHEHFTADEVGTALDTLAAHLNGHDPDSDAARLLVVTRRDFDRARKLPVELVADFARAVARGKEAWKKARATNDFPAFAPHLSRLLDLNRRKAEAYGYTEQAYDALLDEYEPGMTTREVAGVFDALRRDLVPLVQAITERPAPDDTFLHQPYDPQIQWDFGLDVIRNFGYDFNRGRQDRSAHPFSTSFSIFDVRLTTRVAEQFLPTALFGTLHEAGHGMYEQGIAPELDRTPLAQGTSLGMHESQSRLWENLIGRGRAFWTYYYPRLQEQFPDRLGPVSLDAFYRAINKVAPSLIRVEADEVTYNLHIMLRFELEQALIRGDLAVADLPAAWNDRMDAYLGLHPTTDADGVLQDIHWSLGTIGYFPTYSLGNLMSAQLFEAARAALPDLDDQVARGDFGPLHGWLQASVYRHGRKFEAGTLLERITGRRLQAGSWLAYVRSKFGTLYGLD